MRLLLTLMLLGLTLVAPMARAAEGQPPLYLWYEPEWFPGVEGGFAYWPGYESTKPSGKWGIAGPGISAEFSQGGESEWNSMGAPAAETAASCGREIVIPRAGHYRAWVRYVDHRGKTEPFAIRVEQPGGKGITGELGVQPAVPPNDEYMLYWGFSFGWAMVEGDLQQGPANLRVIIDKPGQAWRQVDAVLITDDAAYVPTGREKPHFAYFDAFGLAPGNGAAWRGGGTGFTAGAGWKRTPTAAGDFSMWTGLGNDTAWWDKQDPTKIEKYDVFFQQAAPADIGKEFREQFAGRRDLPIMSWPHLMPGVYLQTPDLSPDTPLRQWLERTKTPFYMLTNYANPNYTDKNGPATYAALSGSLAPQFLGYIHGEAIGTNGVGAALKNPPPTRRAYIDAWAREIRQTQQQKWKDIYKTEVPESFCDKSISCLSVHSITLAHMFHEMGSKTVGYELDATNAHVPMRIAFERGAARQYGASWLNYASGNFGDACNYFTQKPIVGRGAEGWYHSKYAITDGVSAVWYRKMYYLNYLGGSSAIFWEQGLGNQWMKPGPGTHPVQLSPFGRATEDFLAFADRLPDRGEPYTPIAFLLSYGHGYESVSYDCKSLMAYNQDNNDRELRELFNVAWHPSTINESMPITPDLQSMPNGRYGNIFDVLVDRPARAKAILDYPIVWAAGDVELGGAMAAPIEQYVRGGGTLVVNINAARGKLPPALLGLKPDAKARVCEGWTPEGGTAQVSTPYEVFSAQLAGAKALIWAAPGVPLVTRNAVGKGAVIVTLAPGMMGQDERAHPALVYLMNALTEGVLPVDVLLPDGRRPNGEIMYQVNRTKDGWLMMLVNNRGVDKTQSGIARVDRTASVDVLLRTSLPVKSAQEYTSPRPLTVQKRGANNEVSVRVPPGDVQVVYFATN